MDTLDQTMVNAMEQMVDTRSCSRHPGLVTDGSGQIAVTFAAPLVKAESVTPTA
jgi:hypothetical protein